MCNWAVILSLMKAVNNVKMKLKLDYFLLFGVTTKKIVFEKIMH